MHPSELKNQALVAASMAERDGFTATAEALKLLAITCATEARDLLTSAARTSGQGVNNSTQDRFRQVTLTH